MKVRLRGIEREDLEKLRDWRNSDGIRNRTREYRLLNMENQKDWFERISRDRDNVMFGIEVDGWGLVGVCGLCYINWVSQNAEVSFYIDPKYQDTKVESEAFALLVDKARLELNLTRLWAENYTFYTHGIQVLEEAGFQLEGTMRRHVYKQGRYYDSLLYGKLLHEQAE